MPFSVGKSYIIDSTICKKVVAYQLAIKNKNLSECDKLPLSSKDIDFCKYDAFPEILALVYRESYTLNVKGLTSDEISMHFSKNKETLKVFCDYAVTERPDLIKYNKDNDVDHRFTRNFEESCRLR